MKHIGLILLLVCGSTQVSAQSSLLTASPIPDNAETRFCYYASLAYSKNSYVLLTGTRAQETVSEAAG